MSIKLMSYNIRHGLGMDGILDLSRGGYDKIAHAPDMWIAGNRQLLYAV